MINLKPDDYYTQRNNPTVTGYENEKLYSSSQCMNTSYVMFLIGNKIPFENPTDLPHDAYFGKLLISDDAYAFAHSKYPELIEKGIPPVEIHGMYGSYLSPIVCGKRVSDFRTDLSFYDFVDIIFHGGVIMTSGRFPEAGIIGHAFCVIGHVENLYEGQLILADPWGDYTNNYRSQNGYGIHMNHEDFMKHVKPGIEKWGHVLLEEING